jgi:protein-tyrosine phosphatase
MTHADASENQNQPAIVPEADLHCHILPDWDDGPRTLDESLRMARRAADAGLSKILVTPHVGRRVRGPEKPSREIPGATQKLQEEINAAGIPIELIPGAELSLAAPELPERVARHPWLTIGGQNQFILLESPFPDWPGFAEKMLFQLSLKGVTIIIAHPERYINVQKDLSLMEQAVRQGALLQITARSFHSPESRPVHKTAMKMLEMGMVSFVASDLHTDKGARVIDAVDIVTQTVGEDEARTIFIDNPRKVLAGEFIHAPEIRAVQKKSGLFSGLFSKLGK